MVDQVQNTMNNMEQYRMAMSNVEQYRMTMNIINTWEMYRTHVMYVFAALLVLTIILFVVKSCWKKTVLFLTILAGLTFGVFEGFKMYVEYKKKEIKTELIASVATMAEETIPTPADKTVNTAKEGFAGLNK